MKAEIVMIGTELLLGQIEDTNATYMSQVLAENGVNLYQKTTVGDNKERIVDALDQALARSDVVLCSGGLGPTEDDITRECVAEVMGKPLEYHEDIFEHIEGMFARYRIQLTENNKRQAFAPEGAIIVGNPNGTAPGLIVEGEKGVIICMPGVPRELKAMLTDTIIPYLNEKHGVTGLIHYRVLKVSGLGESRVDAAIADLMTDQQNPTVGVLANPAWVRIRIAARAETLEEAEAMIDEVDAKVRERLPGLIMGVDDETLEGVVDALLMDRGWTLSVVETASGGMISQRLTSQTARSFAGGRVRPDDHLDLEHPKETAFQLAENEMKETGATCGLGVVGDPRTGRTIVAFIHPGGTMDWEFGRAGKDERMQMRTAVVTLENLRRYLIDSQPA